MNRSVLISIAVLAALASASCGNKQSKSTDISEDDQKTLYTLGLLTGRNLKSFHLTADELAHVKRGLTDAVLGNKPEVDPQTWASKVAELAKQRTAGKTDAEKEKGKVFADTATKEAGAEALPSGTIYKINVAGNGPSPTATDIVRVKYRGTLVDGTEFDKSENASIPLSGVIQCWTEGMQKMKVGGQARLVCPSSVAYGDIGRPPTIPGGATLVFDIELLGIGADGSGSTPPK